MFYGAGDRGRALRARFSSARGHTGMRIDPNANVEAFARLADKSGEVRMQVGIGVMKQALQSAEAATLQLLQSMQPHLGKKVDVRL
jgi:GTP cyclohydrolase III